MIAYLVAAAAGPAGLSAQERPATIRVLFVGNSLTYYNNLGAIVTALAASRTEGPRIETASALRGGVGLEWHLRNGQALPLIRQGGWDYVVLQDQSLLGGSVVEQRAELGDLGQFYASVGAMVAEVRAAGAEPILYMTWARRSDLIDNTVDFTRRLAAAYETAGEREGARVAPVGLAWKEARRRLISLDLHSFDGVHPSPAGSYLAACVLYATITGLSPVGAPELIIGTPLYESDVDDSEVLEYSDEQVPLVDLRPSTAREFQEIAWFIVRARVR